MTNRNEAPVLDRLIRRVVSVEVQVPATMIYTYDAQELSGFGTILMEDGGGQATLYLRSPRMIATVSNSQTT